MLNLVLHVEHNWMIIVYTAVYISSLLQDMGEYCQADMFLFYLSWSGIVPLAFALKLPNFLVIEKFVKIFSSVTGTQRHTKTRDNYVCSCLWFVHSSSKGPQNQRFNKIGIKTLSHQTPKEEKKWLGY